MVTVGTSNDYNCTAVATMRKCFYAAGRFWVFYSDGVNLVYVSSADGLNWTSPVSVGACSVGYRGSVWFDGTYFHYTRYAPYNTYYRRGKPNFDGSISWSASEQVVYEGSATPDVYLIPTVAVDDKGYPWIGVQHQLGAVRVPKVVKSSRNNGTWATEFTYTLNETSDNNWWVTVVPLTKGKVYVVYARGDPTLDLYYLPLGRLYDGLNFGSEENNLASEKVYAGLAMSAEAEGDDVHFAYLTELGIEQIRYNRRIYGVGWLGDEKVVTVYPEEAHSHFSVPAITVDKTRKAIYVSWIYWTQQAGGGVRCRRRITGKWEGYSSKVNVETEPTDNELAITSFNRDYGGKIGMLYPTKLLPPMNVRFTWLNVLGAVCAKPRFGG
jgi:hypothetical protein